MSDAVAVIWDERVKAYDFGPGHPLTPLRVQLAMRLVQEFGGAFSDLQQTQHTLSDLMKREAQLREKQEFHQYQLAEIDAVEPKPDEDIAIQQELKIMENSERIFDLTSALHQVLYDADNSVRDQLLRARNIFDQLVHIDPTFAEYRDECISAVSIVPSPPASTRPASAATSSPTHCAPPTSPTSRSIPARAIAACTTRS